MANSNTFVDGFTSGGEQVTTLSQVQGAGLTIPSGDFINVRAPGKLEMLFNSNGNAAKLYSINKPEDVGLADALKRRYDYKNPNQGQASRVTSMVGFAAQDANLVRKFLGSGPGTRFITKQLVLQGFQAFDETKVYNPASPLIAAIKPASFGVLDRPTRHVDTSNIIGGIINGVGLGSVVSTIGALVGGAPAQPPPPRSSVASTASNGLGLSTLTSFIGGGDRTSEVVTPIARGDVKDLLRGQTATNAYNAPRYARLVNNSGGGFFSRLVGSVGSFFQNNTVVGGILPPKQPWASKYRADEETYDLMLNAGKLFDPNATGIGGGGIMSGLLNSIGFGKKANYSLAVNQRFYGKSKKPTSLTRLLIVNNVSKDGVANKDGFIFTKEIGVLSKDKNSLLSTKLTTKAITPSGDSNRYSDVVKVDVDNEYSDQILNYTTYLDKKSRFKTTFSDQTSPAVKDIIANLDKAINAIRGANESKYGIGFTGKKNLQPLQFAKFSNDGTRIGANYLNQLDPTNLNDPYAKNDTYQGRFRRDETTGNKVPTRLGEGPNDRYIRPTNNVDYVNSLEVLRPDQFDTLYTQQANGYGPDIIKFYFYDIVNKKYIPFNATIKSLSDNNAAEWETVEYLGRPDKLKYYKGFTRSVSFNFTVNAHSIKELMPMWNRINYLTGLTRPANYTDQAAGGFMISPMVQLTLGDFYKNHNVTINSCNVTIPEDTSWETIPENAANSWYYGPNKAIEWSSSTTIINPRGDKAASYGRVAQFPRTAEIQIEMSVLEKDRPKTGRAIWGDAPVLIFNLSEIDEGPGMVDNYSDKDYTDPANNTFSKNIRYDNDVNTKNV